MASSPTRKHKLYNSKFQNDWIKECEFILFMFIYYKYVITINIKPFLCFDSQK